MKGGQGGQDQEAALLERRSDLSAELSNDDTQKLPHSMQLTTVDMEDFGNANTIIVLTEPLSQAEDSDDEPDGKSSKYTKPSVGLHCPDSTHGTTNTNR